MSSSVEDTTAETAQDVTLPGSGAGLFDHAGAAEFAYYAPESDGHLVTPDGNGHQEVREFGTLTGDSAPAAPAAFQLVRGSYRSAGAQVLELRVDVDGPGALHKVSGDLFTSGGGTTSYSGSFIVDAPTVAVSPTQVVITGQGRFTAPTAFPVVQVTIPRRTVQQPHAEAVVRFVAPPDQVGSSFTCSFRSPHFRTVEWEQDSVTGTVPFVSYDTGSLPQPPGSPARTLTVPRAFAEAGIDVLVSGAPNVLADNPGGWTERELHAAMETNFSLWRNTPQWRVWLLVASRFEGNPKVRGIMFDFEGAFQRQGFAVFHDLIQGADAASRRAQLRTYVHELGHAFNLMHSWDKLSAVPPAPLGPNNGFGDLSWMNYAQNYDPGNGAPSGTAAYWAAFPFSFTQEELLHLRHGSYRDVAMGGNAFGRGAADVDPDLFAAPVADESGLRLDLRATKPAYTFGEPVVVELRLDSTDMRGRGTHDHLHPNYDLVDIAIEQPSGRTVRYRPLLRRCVEPEATVRLEPGKPVYASAYIGYGQDGHYFQQPGVYRLRASYTASDGSRIVSPVLRTVVRHPLTEDDERVAELLLGEEQGTLLALRGSDSPALRAGGDALQEVVERFPDNPLAVYVRMLKGLNAEREFKYLTADKTELRVRPAHPAEAIGELTSVVEASGEEGHGVDDITLNMVMRRLARAHATDGDLEQADAVLDALVRRFPPQRYNRQVVETVRRQAEETRGSIKE